MDVGEDGVMSIPRFVVWVEVGVEFEDRGVGVEHVFAVGGVVSAHEALFGAVVDAWDAAEGEHQRQVLGPLLGAAGEAHGVVGLGTVVV